MSHVFVSDRGKLIAVDFQHVGQWPSAHQLPDQVPTNYFKLFPFRNDFCSSTEELASGQLFIERFTKLLPSNRKLWL